MNSFTNFVATSFHYRDIDQYVGGHLGFVRFGEKKRLEKWLVILAVSVLSQKMAQVKGEVVLFCSEVHLFPLWSPTTSTDGRQ